MGRIVAREAKPQLDALAGRDRDAVPARHLGSDLRGVHRRRAGDDVIVDAILRVGRSRGDAKQARRICFVLAEQQFRNASGRIGPRGQAPLPDAGVFRDRRRVRTFGVGLDRGPRIIVPPRPAVAEPQRRQHMQLGRLRAGVADLIRTHRSRGSAFA